ncbi:MAG TPA: phosphoenolpyruvate--protein phosphotransferase [Candidatus Choladousia intestinigallinarum]|nr:phosphoenolpyruvate--protein phosphotransferase [Candidatus Choladousia intestinigallinarum]
MKKWEVKKTASKGYAIGPAYVVKKQEVTVDTASISADQVDAEVSRFEAAVEKAQADLAELAQENAIFAGHFALAGDIAIHDGVVGKIKDELMNAEAALMQVKDEYVVIFESMDDEYMRERASDMKDVSKRLLFALKGIDDNPFAAMKEKSVIVAQDLTPSDTAKMNMDLVLGFATEEGGVTSHVSIIAKNMAIPCLVGVGSMLEDVKTGMSMILDAGKGEIFLDPDEAMVAVYKEKAEKFEAFQKELESLSSLPSETKDGHGFSLCANVGNIEDIKYATQFQIEGVGLFRSEFLYMESDHFPTEEEQFEAYKEAAQLLGGKELTIRTLDIGGDKELDYYEFPKEENPFLGYRAIRMCLDQTDVFKTQLRAILRASAFGYIRIMYPMMISMDELTAANHLLEVCKAELKQEHVAFDEKIQVGMMIETPAAVMMAEEFAQKVDFFSIGTNDLTQYFLAVDRGNQKIANLYNSFNPAVLRAIYHTIQAGHRHNTKVGMCGEFASDEKASKLLLGMGLDEFSMSAGEVARVKYQLRGCTFEVAEKLADAALKLDTAEKVLELLENS